MPVHDHAIWLEVLGVLPQTEDASGDEYVREGAIRVGSGGELHVTWDITDASVRLRHAKSGGVLVDLYREAATRVLVEKDAGLAAQVVDYRSADSIGRLRVR